MHLYAGPLSLFSRKVEIALREKGLAFERTTVAFSQAGGYAPRHAAVSAANPKAEVPVLLVGELALYDSTVILEYLEDAHPEPPLYPRSPAARARCRLLELAADEILLKPVRSLMFRTEPPTDAARRARQEGEAGAAEHLIADHHRRLADRLAERDFLCGAFTVADIATFMVVHWAQRLGGPPLDPCPNLRHWYERLAARPSFAAVIAEIAAADAALSHPVARAGSQAE
jgi:glutathione S-transferase